jgi:hypothetical protein
MTCEVVVMNRHAVALAADSAVTVTQWVDGKEEKRFFKSVNKVFQLSKAHPIGMMIYGSGDLQAVPWELIAKEYRKHLGDKAFDTVEQYAQDFFSFIQTNSGIFPREYQEELFVADCVKAAIRVYVHEIDSNENFKQANDENKKRFSDNFLTTVISNLDKLSFLNSFKEEDYIESAKLFHEKIVQELASVEGLKFVDISKLAELSIKAVYKKQAYMAESGVVFAGYGDKDYFPACRSYKCFGNILGKIAIIPEDSIQIDYHNHSSIKCFATTQMVDTFMKGISKFAFATSIEEAEQALRKFAETSGMESSPELEERITKEVSDFADRLINSCNLKHHAPLTRIIASLPVDDMAELAETLVTLESLKEKVTQPTESVGGPVDVAVITKAEGLVWIKRKHYFNAEINPRYFERQS